MLSVILKDYRKIQNTEDQSEHSEAELGSDCNSGVQHSFPPAKKLSVSLTNCKKRDWISQRERPNPHSASGEAKQHQKTKAKKPINCSQCGKRFVCLSFL
ncbi:hypothetical protein J4Q44_G00389140 [Coregonus suidteri]|uniref:Uncharacterized protein n=1 Tax=Coregonus suidteri TaxID=861788 RepID=A0AAN8KE59_9TELE